MRLNILIKNRRDFFMKQTIFIKNIAMEMPPVTVGKVFFPAEEAQCAASGGLKITTLQP